MKMKNEYEYGERRLATTPPREVRGWIPSRPSRPFPSIHTKRREQKEEESYFVGVAQKI
jgi:hypothetical protein